MKIAAHNDRQVGFGGGSGWHIRAQRCEFAPQVVVTHTRKGLLAAIAAAALFTLVSVVLDAKHPIFWIKCTRHSAENAAREDSACFLCPNSCCLSGSVS